MTSPIGSNGDDPIPTSDVPASILEFISDQYSNYQIREIESEDICDDQLVYEVELEDGPGPDLELYFTPQWEFLFEMIEINESGLPSSVVDAINESYPNHEIEKDDLYQLNWFDDSIKYQVELEGKDNASSDPEIIFNQDGTIYCIDD